MPVNLSIDRDSRLRTEHETKLSAFCCRPGHPTTDPTSTPSTASPTSRTDLGSRPAHRLALPPAGATGRLVVMLFAAVMLVVGFINGRRSSDSIPVVPESIVVSERAPRAIATQYVGPFTLRISDMRDQLSLLATDADGSTVPPERLGARAWYARAGGVATPVALEPMNDHLMARVDPRQEGILTIALRAHERNERVAVELPVRGQQEAP